MTMYPSHNETAADIRRRSAGQMLPLYEKLYPQLYPPNQQHVQPAPVTGLPTDADARKALPIASGVLSYFPDAIAAVAEVSRIGNDQHNPGKPLHWRRGASTDHDDCAVRHFVERGTNDIDGGRHTAKAAWRVLARLQMEIEAERAGMAYPDYITKVQKEES